MLNLGEFASDMFMFTVCFRKQRSLNQITEKKIGVAKQFLFGVCVCVCERQFSGENHATEQQTKIRI